MKLVNLTPHTIAVHSNGLIIEVKPEPTPVRVETREIEKGGVTLEDGTTIPLRKSEFGETIGLPEPEVGVCYIVSMVVAQANPDRHDLICPDTFKGAIRDADGKIIGTKNFVSYAN